MRDEQAGKIRVSEELLEGLCARADSWREQAHELAEELEQEKAKVAHLRGVAGVIEESEAA